MHECETQEGMPTGSMHAVLLHILHVITFNVPVKFLSMTYIVLRAGDLLSDFGQLLINVTPLLLGCIICHIVFDSSLQCGQSVRHFSIYSNKDKQKLREHNMG